ncbi:hypothetical protein ACLOJK_003283 [Asimina triloba]
MVVECIEGREVVVLGVEKSEARGIPDEVAATASSMPMMSAVTVVCCGRDMPIPTCKRAGDGSSRASSSDDEAVWVRWQQLVARQQVWRRAVHASLGRHRWAKMTVLGSELGRGGTSTASVGFVASGGSELGRTTATQWMAWIDRSRPHRRRKMKADAFGKKRRGMKMNLLMTGEEDLPHVATVINVG